MNQTFAVTIDWTSFTASQVKWYRNTTLIATDTVSGNTVSRTFNVGTTFNAGDRLYVRAVASDGTVSAQFAANFEIASPPPGLTAGMLFFQNGKYKSAPFNIGFPELKKDPPVLTGNNTIPEIAQFDWNSIIEVTAEIDLNGHAEIKAGSDYMELAKDDFKLSGLEVGGRLKVVLTFDYASGQWILGGGFDLSVFGEYTAPPKYVVFTVGFVPVPTYYRFAIDASVEADCRFTDGSANNPIFSGEIPVTAGVEGMAGAGIADCAAIEGYLRGGLNFDFQLPQEPYLKDWYLTLDGGIRICALGFTYGQPLLSYRWPQEQSAMTFGMKALTVGNFKPMSRDYLAGNYAEWYGSGSKLKTMDMQLLGAGGTETTLQTNIFGQSNAAIVVSGNTKCLAWLYDKPSRNILDRTMLVYSINNGSGWSAPTAVNDDGTADAMPALAVDSNGNFVCVWANASQLIPDGTNLSGFADKLDIKIATYNSVSNTWTSEAVTSASAMDYNPKVASDTSGNTTVVWTHYNNNDMLAENSPVSNTLLARTKTGTGWQTTQTLATVNGLVKYTDIHANSAGTHIVYCLDSDSDLQTDIDDELYYINNVGGTWSTPIRLTNNTIADVNPKFVKTSSGLMLLWARDGNIVSTTDIPGMTGITEVVAQQGSSGQRSFVAAASPTGNISVIWNDPSAAGSDIYTTTYDPTMLVWSNVVQITDNRDMERSICAAYSAADTLELAYNKVHVVDGNGLGVFGQVDLCIYEYPIGSDLTVNSDSIMITDFNAVPGDTVTLQATIANIGDVSIDNIPVAFYCGETADPCNQIGQTQIITTTLAAGGQTTVSVSWTIPDSNDPLNLIVVIDPNLQIEDRNRQNNSASTKMFGADLAVENVVINRDVNDTVYITADVVNTGFIPVSAGVKFIVTSPNNSSALDNQLVAALEPGQSHTITLTVSSGQLDDGFNELNLIVDPNNTIVEISKINNTRSIIVKNTAIGKVAAPTILPNGGTFTGSTQVTLSCSTSGATIRYTTNGTDPTLSSTLYSSPFTVSTSSAIKARGFKSGYTNSDVASVDFTISISQTDILLINKCSITAGVSANDNKDGLTLSGTIGVTPADFSGAGEITVNIGEVYSEAISVSSFIAKNGKYTYTYIIPRYGQGRITSLVIDTKTHKFSLKLQKVDLTSLHCPFGIEFEIGSYWGICTIGENTVNGKQLIPIQLMSGFDDYLQIQSVKVKKGNLSNTLTIKGGIAYEVLPTSMSDVVLTLKGQTGQTFTIPAGSFKPSGRSGLKYVCKNAKVTEGGIASATFDFGKCTFVISIKNTKINSASGAIDLTLTIGSFNEQVNFDLDTGQTIY